MYEADLGFQRFSHRIEELEEKETITWKEYKWLYWVKHNHKNSMPTLIIQEPATSGIS